MLWLAASFAVALGFVVLWQAVADAKLISPLFLPGPDRAWASLVNGFRNGDLAGKWLGTVQRMVYGWLGASVAGIAFGAMIGSSGTARAYLGPTLELIRPLPASAVIPVAIAVLGLSDAMVLCVVCFGALWPMVLATVHGFGSVEPRLHEVGRTLHLSRWEFVRKIALPSSLPDILAGMRISLTMALVLSVVCEMLAGRDGLGNWILIAARTFRASDLFAGVILLGFTGLVSASLLTIAEGRLLRWRTRG
jgi:ABC-type nitrate/sulfonate/bicarbonate transport system permease component